MNPESSDLQFAGSTSNASGGIHPPIGNPKIPEIHSNGLVGTNSQPHGYPYSTYTSLRGMPQNMYSRGPVGTNVSPCTSSDNGTASWPRANIRTFRPNAVGIRGSVPLGTAGNQDRVFHNCDARVVTAHPQQKGVTSFQTLGKEAVYMIGPKPTTVMNEAGGQEQPVTISRAAFAKSAGSTPDGAVQPSLSSGRRQWSEKHSTTITTNEAEIKCPPSGSSVMSLSCSLSSATHCPSESSSAERRREKPSDVKKKLNAGVVRLLPISDCKVEAAASTTTSGDGGNGFMDAGNSKFLGDDSSSHELVSSSTATNDAFGNIADSSTSTVERKSTKKPANKTPKPGVNILGKIAALGVEPDRQQFLEDLFAFMECRGTPIVTVPVICRQTVDLYRLYHLVKERSGMVEVSKGKRWRDVGSAMGIGGSTSAGFTLKRNYGRYLFPYECKFDRGDVDPAPLLAAMETPSRKDSRRRAAEREREREIELEESQSSCSQLTATGQPVRNNGFSTTNSLSGYNIDNTGNDGMVNAPTSTYMPSTGSAMNSGMAGYQLGFAGSAGNHASVDPTRSSGMNDQRSEFSTMQPFQVSNSYALHSMQCVRSSSLANDGRGISRGSSDYGRALGPAVVQVESSNPSKTDEDMLNSSYGPTMSTSGFTAIGRQAKGERSDETSIGFLNILQPVVTHNEKAGNTSGPCSSRLSSYSTNVPLVETMESRLRDSENKPGSCTSLQQMQGTSNCSTLQTGQPNCVPVSRGNFEGELQQSSSFCQQYQNLVDGSCTSSSSAAELASSPQQHQEHPFTASQVAKKLQFPKSEIAVNSVSLLRCEMQFPPDSVEAKQPLLKKRKTLTHRDIGPIDPWRIMMSLRSGLVSESTWALDVLSVLLHDDFTASAFGLSHVPGLLEVLVEHLRRCLIEIFGDEFFGDLEMFVPQKKTSLDMKSTEAVSVRSESSRTPGNYQETGKSEGDHINNRSDLNDFGNCITSESFALDWQMGHGDTTVHIITHMASDDSSFHERQFFGKNLEVMKRKRSKSNTWTEKGLSTGEELELCSGTLRKIKKTLEIAQNVEASVDTKEDSGDISVSEDSKSNVIANENNTAQLEMERNCDVGSQKDVEYQNPLAVGLSTAFSSDGIQLFTCNHLDSLKQMYGEMGEEIVQPEETLICCWDESKVEVAKRCLCLSNVLRNLSLISGNEAELSRHRGLVLIFSRLLLLHHYHRQNLPGNASLLTGSKPHGSRDDNRSTNRWWWWETLVNLRENCLVVLASIAGQMDLSLFPESICLPLLDGLLHWSICRSAESQDPFPGTSLSVGSLVLETLCKLCVTRANVDLLIATPPFTRIVLLLSHLANLVGESQPQVTRELALGLMSRIVRVDTSAARALALERSAVSFLLEFIEGAEHQARLIANTQGIEILQDFPETIGTSVDMLCRAADVLLCLAQIPANSGILLRFHRRLLHLVMSQILDCKVTAILAEVLTSATPT